MYIHKPGIVGHRHIEEKERKSTTERIAKTKAKVVDNYVR